LSDKRLLRLRAALAARGEEEGILSVTDEH
jgi:hypothetical protein